MPEAAVVAIEKGRNVPIAIEWTSPRDGIVLERNVTEGMRAQPGEVLFRIADHSVVWAIVDIAERDLGGVTAGQRAIVRARSFPGREFAGRINIIYPQINKETRTARVRVELSNPDLLLIHDDGCAAANWNHRNSGSRRTAIPAVSLVMGIARWLGPQRHVH